MTELGGFTWFIPLMWAIPTYIIWQGQKSEDAFAAVTLCAVTILLTWAGLAIHPFWLIPASGFLLLFWEECGINTDLVWKPVESLWWDLGIIPAMRGITWIPAALLTVGFFPIVWLLGVLNLGRRWLAR